MNREQVWKNFDLGQELLIAGTYLHNGLRRFHEIQTLENTDEIFEFLYDLPVGLERLLKIAVVLLEHTSGTDTADFEESLITHNHHDLLTRVRKHASINTGPEHNRLLTLLSTFYRTFRYDRYSLSLGWAPDKELRAFRAFLTSNLGDTFEEEDRLFAIQNSSRHRKHLTGLIHYLAKGVFDIIRDAAASLHLYTYELRHGSKAERIFLSEKLSFADDDVLLKELLIYFSNTTDTSGMLSLLRSFTPLPFDKALCADYFDCFVAHDRMAFVRDELEQLYSEVAKPGERLRLLEILGSQNVHFPEDDADDEAWSGDGTPAHPNNQHNQGNQPSSEVV